MKKELEPFRRALEKMEARIKVLEENLEIQTKINAKQAEINNGLSTLVRNG